MAAPVKSVSDMRYDPKTPNRSGVNIYKIGFDDVINMFCFRQSHLLVMNTHGRLNDVMYSYKTQSTREILISPEASFFSPKCAKVVSGWDGAPDPAGGANNSPQTP